MAEQATHESIPGTEIDRLTRWMLLLIAAGFVGNLLESWAFAYLDIGEIGLPLSSEESSDKRLVQVALFLTLINIWPLVVVLFARWSRWLPLLRPASLSLLALGVKPLAGLLGWLAVGIRQGRWVSDSVFLVLLFDPLNLVILLFAVLLCWQAGRVVAAQRRLAPDAQQLLPWGRRFGGRLVLAASWLYLLLLSALLVWGQLLYVGDFAFSGHRSWKEKQAVKYLAEGGAHMRRNPQAAEAAFRRALPLWQELTTDSPTHPEYRYSLATTYHNLAIMLDQQGKQDEAEETYRLALSHFNKMEEDLTASQAQSGNGEIDRSRTTILVLPKYYVQDALETHQGRRLESAGQSHAASELYRQALSLLQQQEGKLPKHFDYQRMLATKLNRLAWHLIICTDRKERDPQQVLKLATKAVANVPDEPAFQNTLGAAHYRVGNWQECIASLHKSMQLRDGGDGFDWLFLAMAHHQLGKADEARKWLDKSIRWITLMEQGQCPDPLQQMLWPTQRSEAEMLRHEAADLIQQEKSPTLP